MPPDDLRLVAFDMDGTLLAPRSSWVVLHEAFGTNNDQHHAAYLRHEIDDEQFIRSDVALWQAAMGKIPLARVYGILDNIAPVSGAPETVAALHAAGIATVIITGGLKCLARRLVSEWGMTVAYGNELLADDEGYLTGEGVVEVRAREKDLVLQRVMAERGLTRAQIAAVGDTAIDLTLFKLAGVGIAVNTNDSKLIAGATHHLRQPDLRGILPWLLPGGGA